MGVTSRKWQIELHISDTKEYSIEIPTNCVVADHIIDSVFDDLTSDITKDHFNILHGSH